MRSSTTPVLPVAAATLACALFLPAVLAHGDDDAMNMDADMAMAMPVAANDSRPSLHDMLPSYVHHPEHRGTLLMHIALMTLAWVFVLPIGKLECARER